MTISSCTSKCRVETLQDKEVTDAALESFQNCANECRYSQGDSFLGDFRRLVQSTTALFGHWARFAIVSAPIEKTLQVCLSRLELEVARNKVSAMWQWKSTRVGVRFSESDKHL